MLTRRRAGAAVLALALGLLVARPARGQDVENDDDLRRPERLTAGVADELLGQLGPGGRTLYFASNRNTTHQVFAQELSEGRARMLFDDDADVTWPRVSPDGRALLYISFGERAAGQLCVRSLPDGQARRCLDDPAAALQAEWIDRRRVALVARPSLEGDLRVAEVTVGATLSARPLFDRNLTSPAVSPDGRWLVYVPLERKAAGVGPAFAARAAPLLEATRLGSAGPPARVEIDLPGETGQPAFARDGRSLYFVQFFSDSNHDGVIDADDNGVLFRVPISFAGDAPIAGPPEQLTDESQSCEYPAPGADRLIATCAEDGHLDVYALPLDGEVPADWTAERLATASETAASRVERQLLASRRLARETTITARRTAMLDLAMVHLDLEDYRPAGFFAEHVAALRDPATRGIARPLLALVDQRKAMRDLERGRGLEGFRAGARERLDALRLDPNASPVAAALSHVVASEIADSMGDKERARSELEAVTFDAPLAGPVLDAYSRRADALYRELDDREALAAACRKLSEIPSLPPDSQLDYARAAVRAMTRGLSSVEADARLTRERAAAPGGSELGFALDLARALLALQGDRAPPPVGDALEELYRVQTRPGRRAALVADAARRAREVGANRAIESLAQRYVDDTARGTHDRRPAERLYRRVMTDRAFRRRAERRYAEARADFDAVAAQTGSYEAAGAAIDVRLEMGEPARDIAASYAKPSDGAPLARFAKAYGLARQLPALEGPARAKAAADALAALRASWPELKEKRIAQALFGALQHDEYLRTGDLAAAERASAHYLVALSLARGSPRLRALIVSQLGLLHARVGNYRIALGYLVERDAIPLADGAEGLAVRLAEARALLHVGRSEEAANAADDAVARVERTPSLAPYRVLALDRAALDNLAAGRFARAVTLYDLEIPRLDAAAGPSAARNQFVARVARAAAEVGAQLPDRAIDDLTEVERRLGRPDLVATLRWSRVSSDTVVRTYRLLAAGLRATAERDGGRADAEAKALAERRALLVRSFARTPRAELERATLLTELQLARNASGRHDAAAASSWLVQALVRSDDLRARAGGAFDREQLDAIWVAGALTLSMGVPLVGDLPERLRVAQAELRARQDARLRAYERWFEVYLPAVDPGVPRSPGPEDEGEGEGP